MNTLPLQHDPGTGRFWNFEGLTRRWRAARGAANGPGADANASRERVLKDTRQVRDLALAYRQTNPRFAEDLYAAADRHERLHLD